MSSSVAIPFKRAPSPSSVASSPSSVYVPVHKRTPSVEHERTLPVYTIAELLQLAESPLSKERTAPIHATLHADDELHLISLTKRKQRSREFLARQAEGDRRRAESTSASASASASAAVHTPGPPGAQRRRPIGRATERNATRRAPFGSAKNQFAVDLATNWRVPSAAPRRFDFPSIPVAPVA